MEKGKSSVVKWILLRMRPILRLLQTFRGTPEAIAGGFSVGLFLALTPSVGVQILIAVFLATFLKLSRPACLVGVMVTNPLTIPPLFTFNYWVGSLFFHGPSVSEVYGAFLGMAKEMAKFNIWQIGAQLKIFLQTGQDMLIPLFVGSFLVATVAGLCSYLLLFRLFSFFQSHRMRKVKKNGVEKKEPE